MSISIVILTLNEEKNLLGCLESISWCKDIVVFDSFSVDKTVDIAKSFGARLIQRQFDNYASQRNAALTDVKYTHPWIFMLDADERITPELKKEIQSICNKKESDISLYYIRRKDIFLGRWLKHSSGYPTWFGRLQKIGEVRVEREINEEYHTSGKTAHIEQHMLHYPFNKGISHWFDRHNHYSSMEAATLINETSGNIKISNLFSSNPIEKRKAFKQLAYRLPFRPLLTFIYLYFFRLGFLDRIPGLTYCTLRSIYEYMIDLKIKEIKRKNNDLPF